MKKLWLLLLAVSLFLLGLTTQKAAAGDCLHCLEGHCITDPAGGSCVCVEGGEDICITFGVCWPVVGGGSYCTSEVDQAALENRMEEIAREHPEAIFHVNTNCKKGARAIKDLRTRGVKLNVTFHKG